MPSLRSPWPSLEPCRSFLRGLVYGCDTLTPQQLGALIQLSASDVNAWVRAYQLGPLTYHRYQSTWPQLADLLRDDWLNAAAESQIRNVGLQQAIDALAEENIVPAVLKGALLGSEVYADPGLRTMSDADLWVHPDEMRTAARTLQSASYIPIINEDRPIALQELVEGEIEFVHPVWQQGTIDLHWSPFHGWWYRRATAIDTREAWQRNAPATVADRAVLRMGTEDMVIHSALHLAMSAQFDTHTLIRTLVDVALITQTLPLDWNRLVAIAEAWRVTIPVWTVLHLVNRFIGVEVLEAPLTQLQPGPLRRRMITSLFSPQSFLDQRDWTAASKKLLRFLMLTDELAGLGRFVFRSVWPEAAWLRARYGAPVSNLYHLRRLAGFRD